MVLVYRWQEFPPLLWQDFLDLLRIKGSDHFIEIFLIYPNALLLSRFQRGRLWDTSVYVLFPLLSPGTTTSDRLDEMEDDTGINLGRT